MFNFSVGEKTQAEPKQIEVRFIKSGSSSRKKMTRA
jgi:hypothetical protein